MGKYKGQKGPDFAAVPGPGQFHGGWITSKIVGPFKSEPGTEYW